MFMRRYCLYKAPVVHPIIVLELHISIKIQIKAI